MMISFKNCYISIIFLFFYKSIIIAQDSNLTSQDSSHLGIQLGSNLSAIGHNSSSNFGLNLGMYLNFPFSRKSLIQPEFWYIQKGSIWEWGDSRITYDIAYLQLPVYYSYKLFQRDKMANLLNIQLGPFLSYAVTRKSEELIEYDQGNGDKKLEDIIKKYDYGISFGLQFFPSNNFFLRLIYDHSLSNIFKTSENITHVDASTAKMFSFILFIGFDYSGSTNGLNK